MTYNNKPHFVTSKNFRGDNKYVEWLREIKSRYHTVHYHVAIKINTKSQAAENQSPIKLHQPGAKIDSIGRISFILYDGDKPPLCLGVNLVSWT
ncbi:MAG: hypothetical protein ACI3ZD_18110 [Prevotella sp.]